MYSIEVCKTDARSRGGLQQTAVKIKQTFNTFSKHI